MRNASYLMSFLFAMMLTAGAFADKPAGTLVVKFHADYCGSCKAMQPALDQVRKEHGSDNVAYLVMNYTDEKTTAMSWEIAKAVGIQELVKAQKGKTGFALVVDRTSGEVAGKLGKQHSAQQMAKVIMDAQTKSVSMPLSAKAVAGEADCSACDSEKK